MHETTLRILLIEDNPPDADLLVEMVSGQDGCFQVDHVDRLTEAEKYLKEQHSVDVVLLDLGLPDSDGLVSLEGATRAASHLPIIVLTGLEDEVLGVEAVRRVLKINSRSAPPFEGSEPIRRYAKQVE